MNISQEKLKLLLDHLPSEVGSLIQSLQDKISLLEATNLLLQQENKIMRQSQDIAMASHRELYEENCRLKKQLDMHG